MYMTIVKNMYEFWWFHAKKIDLSNLSIFYQVINIIESDWTLSLEH